MGMYSDFEGYMWGVMGLHGSWYKFARDMGEKIMTMKIDPNLKEILEITPNKLVPGRFYLIQYNFNGNLIKSTRY